MVGMVDCVRQAAKLLPEITYNNFGPAFDHLVSSGTKVTLLGDGSHGTSEFYRGRAAITKQLIEQHGFNFVAVEADWPDAAAIDRFVRLKAKVDPVRTEKSFTRFPTWMWANEEVLEFILWLRSHNERLPEGERVGFYGLDLYSMTTSINAVIQTLERIDPEAAKTARERGYAPCEKQVVQVLRDLLNRRLKEIDVDEEELLDAECNARVVANAEVYYRLMFQNDRESWNQRDRHMFEILNRLLKRKGEAAKGVVWAHNSHVGDARYTSMGMDRGEINIGQLCRQQFDNRAFLMGFGTNTGTVAAARNWDEPLEIMPVNPSLPGSYERLAHETGLPRCLFDLREGANEDLRKTLMQKRLERFIGVIYRPDTERWSHYTDAILPKQFDAYVFIDETSAVKPLNRKVMRVPKEMEETYPFGL